MVMLSVRPLRLSVSLSESAVTVKAYFFSAAKAFEKFAAEYSPGMEKER